LLFDRPVLARHAAGATCTQPPAAALRYQHAAADRDAAIAEALSRFATAIGVPLRKSVLSR
jgi:hypothetical protein